MKPLSKSHPKCKIKVVLKESWSLVQLLRDRNLHGSGISHTMTASPNHPSGYLGGLVTPWLAEEMLDGQYQRVELPAHARTAHKGLLQKRLEEDLS